MLAYPVHLEPDDGAILVTSPDFPELTTFGDNRDEALAYSVGALEEAIAARIHYGEDIPAPSEGPDMVALSGLTEVRVMAYQGGRNRRGIGKE